MVAPRIAESNWQAEAADVPAPEDASLKLALRDAWMADALLEHASVASFGRFALELLAIGAPAEFVVAAHQAALDEAEHTRLCLSIAAAYSDGEPIGPGAMPSIATMPIRTSLRDIALAAVAEGCVGETVAAMSATRALAGCNEPEVRAVLETIAVDELRHAELAWRFVAWAVAASAEVRTAVEEAFADQAATNVGIAIASPAEDAVAADDDGWHAAGRLSAESLRETIRESWERVIVPCARQMLAPRNDPDAAEGTV